MQPCGTSSNILHSWTYLALAQHVVISLCTSMRARPHVDRGQPNGLHELLHPSSILVLLAAPAITSPRRSLNAVSGALILLVCASDPMTNRLAHEQPTHPHTRSANTFRPTTSHLTSAVSRHLLAPLLLAAVPLAHNPTWVQGVCHVNRKQSRFQVSSIRRVRSHTWVSSPHRPSHPIRPRSRIWPPLRSSADHHAL